MLRGSDMQVDELLLRSFPGKVPQLILRLCDDTHAFDVGELIDTLRHGLTHSEKCIPPLVDSQST